MKYSVLSDLTGVNNKIKDFEKYLQLHIFAVDGNLTEENLGISPNVYEKITQEINIVIGNAASMDFTARLDANLQMNTIGAMNVLKFAKSCTNIEVLCHVSTCYVASNKPAGFIEEKINDDENIDLDLLVHDILQMPVKDLEKNQDKLLGGFPNTYTYTKYLSECLLKRHRGSLPVVIIRPSIIGAAALEPFPGWVDAITAGTAIFLAGGLGILREINANVNVNGDNIPVDYVTDMLITATADGMNKDQLKVYHCSSSSRNPHNGGQLIRYMWNYVGRNPFEMQFERPNLDVYKSKALFNTIFYFKRELPARLFYYTSRMIGNRKMRKDSEKYIDALEKCKKIATLFSEFLNTEWIYESYNIYQLNATLSEEDRNTFKLDIGNLDWKVYLAYFIYGIQKYIMKQEVDIPQTPNRNFISIKPTILGDLGFVRRHGKETKSIDQNQLVKIILDNQSVRMTIKSLVKKDLVESPEKESKLIEDYHQKVKEILDRMATRFNHKRLRSLIYLIHKSFRSMYEKIICNTDQLQKIKELSEGNRGNVIYCPTHRSYFDPLILAYVLYSSDIKLPHVCSGEDYYHIAVVYALLRNSGAFFMRRTFKDDPLYKAVFNAYVQQLLVDNHSILFYIEGTRARSGKMLAPKLGMLKVLTDAYFSRKVENLYFVPISISYSRIFEGETFPLELLGENSVEESLTRMLKATKHIKTNFGSIHVQISDPINFKTYLKSLSPSLAFHSPSSILPLLSTHISQYLSSTLTIMPTPIIASLLLMHRKGISQDLLLSHAQSLLTTLIHKHALLGPYCTDAKMCVRKGILHLSETITRSKNGFEPRVLPNGDYKNILLLSYYRNNLVHLFIDEAYISCALTAFHTISGVTQVDRTDLYSRYCFLKNLMRNEFISYHNITTQRSFEDSLELLLDNDYLFETFNGTIVVTPKGTEYMEFLNSLIWPFIDAYWLTLEFILSLVPSKFVQESLMITKVQTLAEMMYKEGGISFYESCSQETIKNAVNTFNSDGVIVKKRLQTSTDGTIDDFIYTLGDDYLVEENMQSLLDRIAFYRKPEKVEPHIITKIKKLVLFPLPKDAKL